VKKNLRIHLHTRRATDADLEGNYEYIDLTPDTDDWNPHDSIFSDQEKSMLDFQGHLSSTKGGKRMIQDLEDFASCQHFDQSFYSEVSAVLSSISSTLDIDCFHNALADTFSGCQCTS